MRIKYHNETLEIDNKRYHISDVNCAGIAVQSYVRKEPIWIRLKPNSNKSYSIEFYLDRIPWSFIKGEMRFHIVWDDGEGLIDLIHHYGWCKYTVVP